MDFGFSSFAGTNFREFGFHTLLLGIIFLQISCTVLESNKTGSHVVVFVTLFATNSIESQLCK